MNKHTFNVTTEEKRKYPYKVYEAVAEYRGLVCDTYAMDIIDCNHKAEVLSDFLNWNGIRGYTITILQIMNA